MTLYVSISLQVRASNNSEASADRSWSWQTIVRVVPLSRMLVCLP